MKRLIPVIPIVIIVGVMSMVMLERSFSDIDRQMRLLIAAAGTIFSGVVGYFLLGSNKKEDEQ